MNNDIKEEQGSRAGRYERSSDVNGKPSYRNDDNAIWHYGENKWMIGSIDNLGSTTGGIYAVDNLGGLTDEKNEWKYWDNGWKTGKNDITVECISGTSKVLKTLLLFCMMNFLV